MSLILEVVASNIWRFRLQRGWTRRELADQMHVVPTAVFHWEKGHNVPRIDTLSELAAVFGISICDLVSPIDKEEL